MIFTKRLFAPCAFFLLIFTGCKSIAQPDTVAVTLDYTKDDVVNSEIENIKRIKKDNPVQALWRSTFLNRKDVTDECILAVQEELKTAVTNKDYFEAYRLMRSAERLQTVNTKM